MCNPGALRELGSPLGGHRRPAAVGAEGGCHGDIELSLVPYKTRLRSNRPAVLVEREKLLDAVQCMFRPDDFMNDNRLAGEFLLGYHCQRAALWAKNPKTEDSPSGVETAQEGEPS